MPLPPKGDPQRPISLAIRSVRVLAILMLLLATCTGGAVAFMPMRGGRPGLAEMAVAAVGLLLYLGPGVLYLVLAIYLQRRRAWAVTTGIVVASLQLLLTLVGVVALILTGGNPIGLSVSLLVVLALGQLIQHLIQSYGSIRAWAGTTQQGFEVQPLSVMPTTDDGPA